MLTTQQPADNNNNNSNKEMEALDQARAQRALNVCRLDIIVNGEVINGGTGFHYGGGWIITNSHVVGENGRNLRNIRIRFEMDNGEIQRDGNGRLYEFQPTFRPCFFVDIRYRTSRADFGRADVAIFSIESENEGRYPPTSLAALQNPRAIVIPNLHQGANQYVPVVNDNTYCYHFGWGSQVVRPNQRLLSANEVVTDVSQRQVDGPTILTRGNVTTSGGSSGAPVFHTETHHLVGIHFAEGGSAVSFSPEISNILRDILPGIRLAHRLQQSFLILTNGSNLSPGFLQSLNREIYDATRSLNTGLFLAYPHMRVVIPYRDREFVIIPWF